MVKRTYKSMIKFLGVEEYDNFLYSECVKNMPKQNNKNNNKLTNDEMIMPCYSNINILFENNYNVQQLKQIISHLDLLKCSGNKKELFNRIYVYLKLSSSIIKIQKIFRGHLLRRCILLRGPALKDRSLCTNDSDFLTGDSFKNMEYTQFFSFKDEDGFIYGFDIISLYNLIIKSGKTIKNPYNRNNITKNIIKNMQDLIKISRLLNSPININIKEETFSDEKSLEMRIIELFQKMDSLGNYTDPNWFNSLNRNKIIKFLRELIDIWSYRAQITHDTKRKICPPNGDPFRGFNFNYIYNEENIDIVKKTVVSILEKLVYNGIDDDHKSLGAYYVLGSLTLVNENAASSLPWLFQSVAHYI